jgi:membrane protease YdiL (CAAX protease family)
MARALAAVGIAAFLSAFLFFGFARERAGAVGMWTVIGAGYVVVAGLVLVASSRRARLRAYFAVRGGDVAFGALAGVTGFGCAYGFSRWVTAPGSPREAWLARAYEQLGDVGMLRTRVGIFAAAVVAMSVLEEVVWRGLVVDLLSPRFGRRGAFVSSTLLYAMAHVPTAFALADAKVGPNPLLVVASLGAGASWAFLAYCRKTLVAGIVAHALFDWLLLAMFRLWGPSL